MSDFYKISERFKNGVYEIFPKFLVYQNGKKSSDLMIRGRDFYAVWDEEKGMWSTDEQDALQMIDKSLYEYAEQRNLPKENVRLFPMWDSDSKMIDKFHSFCQKQMRDNYTALDETIIFSNQESKKEDYATKRLNYPLKEGSFESYDKLMSVLYSPEERHKIEWAIGSIITGDSKILQKFLVLYGASGTGKSTVLKIIKQLFKGYWVTFDAKALGSNNNSFSLETFSSSPLVAIQDDGDLSKIEDNTKLNSLVSHEELVVNAKHKAIYTSSFKCFLFMGTNKPVKITDAKSGLLRRLIDVVPTGNTFSLNEYNTLMHNIKFELGAIAYHCKEVYLENPSIYDNYIPINMMGASNYFFDFVADSYSKFDKEDSVSLQTAWTWYKNYCLDANIDKPYNRVIFKEELKNYFKEYKDRYILPDGTRARSYYIGFKKKLFDVKDEPKKEPKKEQPFVWETTSFFDEFYKDCYAQYANEDGKPSKKWEKVATKLKDIDTSKLHYVLLPESMKNHIMIDFDLKDENGNKSLERNIEAAKKWKKTYTEVSQGGNGIHLHYIYDGDPTELDKYYDKDIEVKVFTGNSSIRRKLTKCNNSSIDIISSGLPLKGKKKVVDFKAIESEKELRNRIKKCLNKEHHGATKPEVDFIYKILDDAYHSGLKYDVEDLHSDILYFASKSTHQAETCIATVNKMKFKSDEPSENKEQYKEDDFVFYDIEVFPNLLLVMAKHSGENSKIIKLLNPSPDEVSALFNLKLIGFNNRRYDNHILYARAQGYSIESLYDLSQKIIAGDRNAFFSQAYNISYTDIYDFSSKKQSLKKWEIELGINHAELGLEWDKPVPEEKWEMVAKYCENDVLATEATFYALSADWTARKILADLAGLTVNDTTNTLTQKIIFGNDRNPSDLFNYRNLAEPVMNLSEEEHSFLNDVCPEMVSKTHGEKGSLLPYFPGYEFKRGVSTYKGFVTGEGGMVYAEPGIYNNVALLDITSMHPYSILDEILFGLRYTKNFKDIVDARVKIKAKDFDSIKNILDGKMVKYIDQIKKGILKAKDVAYALKIAINAVYGQTAATYKNPFVDIRNIDNIVAKRGALFMIDLLKAVNKKGFTVAHIKTDSIKVPNATKEIINYIMDFGKSYGYYFKHEATYERMCLVNDAVYIAKYDNLGDRTSDGEHANEWTATGTQFQVPFIFKTLFSKEQIEFEDMCETKSVAKGSIYLDMNENLPDVSEYEKELDKLNKLLKKETDKTTINKLTKDISKLEEEIAKGHNYIFIGKVGQFCPIKPGCGGGVLYRYNEGKYYALPGSKGYRWLESETVRVLERKDDIDTSYYISLTNEAVDAISKYGNFDDFIN